MLVSYRWLKELLPELAAPPDALADALSGVGLTVDALHSPGAGLGPLVVASVLQVEPHPTLDKVRLVTVDLGAGERQRVVCGASNVPERGGRVLLAPLGTELPAAGIRIAPRNIGGVVSEGMLVSEAELGLSPESNGIVVLEDDSLAAGTAALDACPELCDTLLEIDVTPNRPDALGHVGVARDLAVLYGLDFAVPSASPMHDHAERRIEELVSVEVEDPERCPHYGAGAVLGVRIGPSPAWLRWRLYRLGIRPISNVVDVTNWLLLEFGQPLHAFDLRCVRGGKIVVRRAREREPFTTLDGVERRLEQDDLVICDGEAPLALAGVMGGADSEITSDTRDVLLECAYFAARGVRRTARRHGLHTESSHRFERGTDWGGVELVLERAKALLVEFAGGTPVRGAVHRKSGTLSAPFVTLRASRMNRLLGVELVFQQALETLGRLGFALVDTSADGNQATLRGASHRPDVTLEADLIEEVARLGGLGRIPTVLPRVAVQEPTHAGRLERDTARIACELGLSEAVTYAFVSRAELDVVHAPPAVVTLNNPLSEERSVLRTSLLPGLLEALKRARRRGEADVRLFSVGARFLAPRERETASARPLLHGDTAALPEERPSFAAVLAGSRAEYLSLKPEELDVYDAKGMACELLERLTRRQATVELLSDPDQAPHLHPRGAAELKLAGQRVGLFGPLHPSVVERLDVHGNALVVEVDLAVVEAVGERTPRFVPIPKLPAVTRDVSLVVSDSVSAGEVQELLRAGAGELCESVKLLTLFRGGSVPEAHRSLTFRIVYRDPKARSNVEQGRTLTDEEVDARQLQVLGLLREKLGATLRG